MTKTTKDESIELNFFLVEYIYGESDYTIFVKVEDWLLLPKHNVLPTEEETGGPYLWQIDVPTDQGTERPTHWLMESLSQGPTKLLLSTSKSFHSVPAYKICAWFSQCMIALYFVECRLIKEKIKGKFSILWYLHLHWRLHEKSEENIFLQQNRR